MQNIEAKVDQTKNLTIITVARPVTGAEYIAFIENLYTNTPTSDILWDFAASSLNRLDNDDLQDIVDIAMKLAHLRNNPRTAVVAHKSTEKTVMKFYALLSKTTGSPIAYQLFPNQEAALAWFAGQESEK